MTTCFARVLFLTTAIACSGTARSEATLALPADTPSAARDDVKDWTQARLSLDPALRERIARTRAFLDNSEQGLDSVIHRLRGEGLLDRRIASKIHSALGRARDSMSRLTAGIAANEQIDGWTARMISYDLGIAADSLAKQADAIEMGRGAESGSDGAPTDPSGDGEQQLAQRLKEGSTLLKETAQAIVLDLE
jgi:hypothetical protein